MPGALCVALLLYALLLPLAATAQECGEKGIAVYLPDNGWPPSTFVWDAPGGPGIMPPIPMETANTMGREAVLQWQPDNRAMFGWAGEFPLAFANIATGSINRRIRPPSPQNAPPLTHP